jgi:pSer/pThr/pTyr-binding forkhead associated (FHA) protein|tara:strand:- start:1295 stop:1714 length:420 start_codon:yes stop_codon:yes gene_type:complete
LSKEAFGSDDTARFSDDLIAKNTPVLSDEEAIAVAALPPNSALLISHRGPGSGSRFLLDQDLTIAGRHPEADIFLDDVTVSRKHVQISRARLAFALEDLGSMNGTYVDGNRVDMIDLTDGAEVLIGKFRLTFYSSKKGG